MYVYTDRLIMLSRGILIWSQADEGPCRQAGTGTIRLVGGLSQLPQEFEWEFEGSRAVRIQCHDIVDTVGTVLEIMYSVTACTIGSTAGSPTGRPAQAPAGLYRTVASLQSYDCTLVRCTRKSTSGLAQCHVPRQEMSTYQYVT